MERQLFGHESRQRFLELSIAASWAVLLPRAASAMEPKIRMGAAAAEAFAEPYYCLDGGGFARAGLDVDVVTFPGGGVMQQAVAGNALDVGIVDAIQLANAIGHGFTYQYFAGSVLSTSRAPSAWLCVAKKNGIRRPHDLEGKTIGVAALRPWINSRRATG